MASQMDLKSTTRSRHQSRGDPSRSMTMIHRCYTSPCDSRSDLGTTSEVVFTNNSPPMLSSALVNDSPPLPSAAFADSPRRHLSSTSLAVDSSSPLDGLRRHRSPTSLAIDSSSPLSGLHRHPSPKPLAVVSSSLLGGPHRHPLSPSSCKRAARVADQITPYAADQTFCLKLSHVLIFF